jgi:hypothetical protein
MEIQLSECCRLCTGAQNYTRMSINHYTEFRCLGTCHRHSLHLFIFNPNHSVLPENRILLSPFAAEMIRTVGIVYACFSYCSSKVFFLTLSPLFISPCCVSYQWIKRKGRHAPRALAPIVVSNHVSYIEPIFFFYELFPAIVSHDALPFVGTIIRAMQVKVLTYSSL